MSINITSIAAAEIAETPSKVFDLSYNLRGNIKSYGDGETTTTFGYDKIGRVKNSTTDYGSFSKSHSYDYHKNGQLKSYTDPGQKTYNYKWDNADQLKEISVPDEGLIAYKYNKEDWFRPEQISFPGGTTQNFEYDDYLSSKRIHSKDPTGNTIMDYNYIRNDAGQIKEKQTEHGNYLYDYNDADRLVGVDNPDFEDEAYLYDEFGNRSPRAGPKWEYDESGALKSGDGATYKYDANGNRIEKTDSTGTTKYVYNDNERLVRVENPVGNVIAEYGYNYEGQRIWKKVGEDKTYYYYTEDGLAGEYDKDGNEIKSYLHDPVNYWSTNPLAVRDASGYNYFHNDHLGTPQKLTDRGGQVNWSAKYSAFGKAHVGVSKVKNSLRFPGQYHDGETGLHHNYMRDYDPEVGQYLAQDPYGLITGANRYAYVYGNPVELFDPTGKIVQVFIDQINKTGRQIGGLFEDAWSDPYGRAALIVAGTALAIAALLIAGVAVATVAKIFAIVGAALTLYDVLNCLFCSHTESGMESCNDLAVDGLLYLAGGGIGYGVGKAVKGFRTARKVGGKVDDIGDLLKNATRHRGFFPHRAKPNQVLVRRANDGTPTHYQVYDSNGYPLKRVDLTGRPHGGVETPHVVEFQLNTNPETGITYPKPNNEVRPNLKSQGSGTLGEA